MTRQSETRKRIIVYRDLSSALTNRRDYCFCTKPFLGGVGRGVGANIQSLVEGIREAEKQGYRLEIAKYTPGTGKYPLHPETANELEQALTNSDSYLSQQESHINGDKNGC